MTLVASAPTASTSVAITSTPTPGTPRPSTRVAIGVAKSSTKRNAQTSAATLTMSGTVTKKPVMKLRRSHCMGGPTSTRRRRPRAGPSRRAMRYQANGAKPARPTRRRNGPTTTRAARNAMTKPTAICRKRSAVSDCRTSSRSCAKAAVMVGIDRKKENSAAVRPLEAQGQPADDGRARARHPRHQRQHLAQADAEGPPGRDAVDAVDVGRRAGAARRPASPGRRPRRPRR